MVLHLAEGFRHVPGAYDRIIATAGLGGSFTRTTGKGSGLYALSHPSTNVPDNTSNSGRLEVVVNSNVCALGFSAYFGKNFTGAQDVAGVGIVDQNLASFMCSMGAGAAIGSATSATTGGTSGWSVKDSTPLTIGWHWICVTCNWRQASGGYLRVYRDGTLAAEIAPDTDPSSGYTVGKFRISMGNSHASASSGVLVGDIVVYTGESTYIPEQRVDVLVPDGTITNQWVGSDADSVNNHLLVDDPGPTIDASDYVQSSTVGATDEYTLSNLPHNPSTVAGVQVSVFANRTESGPRALAPLVNGVEGTAYDPGGQGAVTQVYQTNPNGGAAWTKASVDAMTAGARIKA